MHTFNNIDFEYIITAIRKTCPYCGTDEFIKAGFNHDKTKQRLKCINCKRKHTVQPNDIEKRGKSKLLPIHKKSIYNLTAGELYSMGLLISDGSLSNTNQMSISVQESDKELINIVKRELCIPNEPKFIKKDNPNHSDMVRITWASKIAVPYWFNLGFNYHKTGNEMWLDYMCEPNFIRGLFDGDGCFGYYPSATCNGLATIGMASESFIVSLRDYLRTLNIKSRLTTRLKKHLMFYTLKFSINNAEKLGDFIYQGSSSKLRLERKYEVYQAIKNRPNKRRRRSDCL